MTRSTEELIEKPETCAICHSNITGVDGVQIVVRTASTGDEAEPIPVQVDDAVARLAAMSDRAVSRALNLIHTRYRDPLTIDMLAREAGLSRTVLRERFCRFFGHPPMRYCIRWRLRMAATMLTEGNHTAAEVAHAVGFGSEAAFNRAFSRRYGAPPVTWSRQRRSDSGYSGFPRQVVSHCSAPDGARLAWSAVGEGFPLVKTANWLNHLEFDWQSPVWRHWLRELMQSNCLIRYDERGNGLSDWKVPDFSLDAFVDDLEAVIDAAGVEQFDLLGISQGAPVAIAYSLRHPGRIRRMVLLGGFSRGWRLKLTGEALARVQSLVSLSRTGWGSDTPAFRQMFTSLYIPGGTPEQLDWWNELQRVSTSPANAERLQEAIGMFDVSDMLASVEVPTLVAHARRDHVIPISEGRELAKNIRGAKFVELDSENHVLLEHEPAWLEFVRAFRSFLQR